jgi:hypothetical protein
MDTATGPASVKEATHGFHLFRYSEDQRLSNEWLVTVRKSRPHHPSEEGC